MNITINFDMDGTIANLYGVENWLNMLAAENVLPYTIAEPMLRLSALARRLNTLQRRGYRIAIISWLSKTGSPEYNERVAEAKKQWLAYHMPSVKWDDIHIVPYGTPKQNFCHASYDLLFDDEENNRNSWPGPACDASQIMEILRLL